MGRFKEITIHTEHKNEVVSMKIKAEQVLIDVLPENHNFFIAFDKEDKKWFVSEEKCGGRVCADSNRRKCIYYARYRIKSVSPEKFMELTELLTQKRRILQYL